MTSKIVVRALEPQEWTLWREMRLRALAEAPDSFRPTLAEERAHADSFWSEVVGSTATHPRGNLWVAWIGDSPVGMLFGRIDPDFKAMEIGSMWVEPTFRHRGVGSGLVSSALKWAEGLDVRGCSLFCRQDDGVMAFYERLGFESTGETEPLRESSTEVVVRMRARL